MRRRSISRTSITLNWQMLYGFISDHSFQHIIKTLICFHHDHCVSATPSRLLLGTAMPRTTSSSSFDWSSSWGCFRQGTALQLINFYCYLGKRPPGTAGSGYSISSFVVSMLIDHHPTWFLSIFWWFLTISLKIHLQTI